jgi:hypothetical protein
VDPSDSELAKQSPQQSEDLKHYRAESTAFGEDI